MNRTSPGLVYSRPIQLPQWISFLAAGFIFGAVFLRTLLLYRYNPELGQALTLLLIWLVLSVSEPAISHKWPAYLLFYLAFQTILVFVLLALPGFPDFFAVLLSIPGMQAMSRLNPKIGSLWVGLFALMTALLFVRAYGPQAISLSLIYTASYVFLGSYALSTRRAQEARIKNQGLAQELQQGNQKLQAYSAQLEEIAVARERNRLARELHDSVTQTAFSMNLTAQSALLLLDRDPQQVRPQLERLSYLAQKALSEMQLLIAELGPEKPRKGGLVSALRHHLVDSCLAEGLVISLEAEGDEPLEPAEEQGLFRIAQEALNNILKHANASHGQVRLHLSEPFWIEIEDQGQGFDLAQAWDSNRMGLISMHERAAEIGWDLRIITSPGAGTRIRVAKVPVSEVQYDVPR